MKTSLNNLLLPGFLNRKKCSRGCGIISFLSRVPPLVSRGCSTATMNVLWLKGLAMANPDNRKFTRTGDYYGGALSIPPVQR